MAYLASSRTKSQRSYLLAVVVGAHVVVGALLFLAKTVVPVVQEMPLFVDFLASEQPRSAPPKPLPPKAAQPDKAPVKLEATRSQQQAEAPVAPVQESRPAPAAPTAPVAEPVVSQARFDADYLRNPAPPYPPLARRAGEEGKVILRVQVSAQGAAEAVEIKTSSGSSRLDESAQKTVRTWKFLPAKRGDAPVQSWVLVPIIFKLEQ